MQEPLKERGDLVTISGTVEDVIYRNDENGYSVIVTEYEGEPLTVVGIMPKVKLGNDIRVMG